MKFCPQCHSSYADDSLRFCLQDGTLLTDQSDPQTEQPTVFFGSHSSAKPSEDVTEQFSGQPATRRYTTNKEIDQKASDVWKLSQETITASVPPPVTQVNRSNTLVAVLATVLVMLLLFGAAGLGVWFYFSPKNSEIAERNDNQKKTDNQTKNVAEPNSGTEKTPVPTVSPTADPSRLPTLESSPDRTPVANFDPEQVKRDVAGRVFGWKSQAESRNLNGYMSYYAGTLDYYNKNGVSREFVRGDKQKAFSKYDRIEIKITNLSIVPDATGRYATAVFDKEWYFANAVKTSEGKVKSQLKLVQADGQWQITGERDLKIYYVK